MPNRKQHTDPIYECTDRNKDNPNHKPLDVDIKRLIGDFKRIHNPYGQYPEYRQKARHTGFEKCRQRVISTLEARIR